MLPVLSVLLLGLPAAVLSASVSTARVYLSPPTASTAQGAAVLAQHLGLEAFESHSRGEVVLGNAKVFVGEGAKDALLVSLDASHPEDVIPESLKPSSTLSTFSIPIASILERYTRLAHAVYSSVLSAASKPSKQPLRFLDVFSLASASASPKSEALEKFMGSLGALVAFVEESHDEAGERFGAFDVKGLRDIEAEWGRESELYITATSTLKATIQSAITARSLSLAVLIPVHAHTSRQEALQPPQSPLPVPSIPPTAPIFSTSTCHSSASACLNATSSCSSRGDCVGVTRAGRTCFVCECGSAPLEEGGKNISWAGAQCQKKDISQQFTLIVGTVIFLILIVVGSTALLYTVGDQELPGVLTGGVGHMKRE